MSSLLHIAISMGPKNMFFNQAIWAKIMIGALKIIKNKGGQSLLERDPWRNELVIQEIVGDFGCFWKVSVNLKSVLFNFYCKQLEC